MLTKQLKSLLQKIGKYDSFQDIQEIRESTNNKVFAHKDIICKISKKSTNLQLEYNVLKKLENKGKFPKAIHYEALGEDYYLIMEKLEGRGIEYERVKYTESQKKSIISDIIKNIKIIHSVPATDKFSYIQKMLEDFDKYYKIAQKNPNISVPILDNIAEIFHKKIKKYQENNQSILIHNDLRYKNILVSDGKLSGIIDFETAVYGPKEFELFRLIHHKYSAQTYLDSGTEEYTEMEYLDLLFKTLKVEYPEIFIYDQDLFDCYNLRSYMAKLSKYKESWYVHEEVEKFWTVFFVGE